MVLGFSAMLPVGLIGAFSILVLVYSAEVVVSKMQGVAKHYGVSEVVIAMTIVSVGTSLPELSLHLVGSFNILLSDGNILAFALNQPLAFMLDSFGVVLSSEATTGFRDISATVLGSNIGSDVVQQTLVLGSVIVLSALFADKHSFKFSRKFLIRDYAPMMGTTLMTLILALNWPAVVNFVMNGGRLVAGGTLTRLDGIILVGSFTAYIYYLYTTRKEELAEQGDTEASQKPRMDFAVGLLAMFFVIGSAEIFLDVVKVLIAQTGLSGSMIGVASVGVVSAFPEMITAISGLRHGSEGISLGTLIGSNITNPLLAIGLGSMISTYAVPGPLVLWDLPMETATAGVLLGYMFSKDAIGDFLGKWARKAGFTGLAERFEAMENRVISIAGAGLLVILYIFYMYVRFKYFQYDFIG